MGSGDGDEFGIFYHNAKKKASVLFLRKMADNTMVFDWRLTSQASAWNDPVKQKDPGAQHAPGLPFEKKR